MQNGVLGEGSFVLQFASCFDSFVASRLRLRPFVRPSTLTGRVVGRRVRVGTRGTVAVVGAIGSSMGDQSLTDV